MDSVISLLTKPLSLASLIVLAGVRSVSVATLAWWNLVRGIVDFHLQVCWRAVVWIIAFASLPARIFGALQRERRLEMYLHELQTMLESALCENKELEQRLQIAIKERKVIETILEEIEEEHEKALFRIDQLDNKLQVLKEENMRLNEMQGKAPWDYKACDEKIESVQEGIPVTSNYVVPSWSAGYKSGGAILQDILLQGDSLGDAEKSKSAEHSPCRPPLSPFTYSSPHQLRDSIVDEMLERQRAVALSRSLFSSILSLIVGMIIWKAEDPCMPLVTALFIVVGMSLNSVVQFFSTIKNKPASDAVALLSINWFILGTLTYPALPSVARMLAPRVIRITERFLFWLGFSSLW